MVASRPFAAHQQPHLLGVAREIDRGLSSRIARPDQRHFLTAAKLRLDRRRPVVDGRSFEFAEIWQIKTTITRSARQHHGARLQGLVIANAQDVASAVFNCPAHPTDALLPESPFPRRTSAPDYRRAPINAMPGNAGWKSQIVFNARRSAGLASEGAAIEHDHLQAFRGRINGSGQSGRPRADDCNVIEFRRIDRAVPTRYSAPTRSRSGCAAACRWDITLWANNARRH